MDLYCVNCGEPWENDTLHEEVEARGAEGYPTEYRAVLRDFQTRGCEALSLSMGTLDCQPAKTVRTEAMSVMFDLMGDDADGAASMMDDFEHMGYFD